MNEADLYKIAAECLKPFDGSPHRGQQIADKIVAALQSAIDAARYANANELFAAYNIIESLYNQAHGRKMEIDWRVVDEWLKRNASIRAKKTPPARG